MTEITVLEKGDENAYNELLQNCTEAMLYHSLKYQELLIRFIEAKSIILIAKNYDKIVGALPLFLKENNTYGNVINSLPFYGSNGGFIVDKRLNYLEKTEIKKELLKKFHELANENNCISSTIVSSPFDRDILFYENYLDYKFRDIKIGYIKEFDHSLACPNSVVLHTVSRKCRGSINRGGKSLVQESSTDFTDFFKMHKEAMYKYSTYKPMKFFDLIKEIMAPTEFKLSYALYNDERVGGNLYLYFQNTIEWYATGVYNDFRSEQPTSFLHFCEMKYGIENGYKYFDFGGTTLPSQLGVAKFKHSWGSEEYPYYLYITLYDNSDKIFELKSDEILKKYKWFYVIPFTELSNENK